MSGVIANGRFLTRSSTGVDRVAFELLRACMQELERPAHISVAVPISTTIDPRRSSIFNIRKLGKLRGHAWEQIDLPKVGRQEFLLNLCNTAPIFHPHQLVMLHDASVFAVPQAFSRSFRLWYRFLFRRLMKTARVVTTVSKFSADELQKFVGRRLVPIEVIYPAAGHIRRVVADHTILERLQLQNQRYILGVGTRSIIKNFTALSKSMAGLSDLQLKMVVVGGSNASVFSNVVPGAGDYIAAGYVNDAELKALYGNAECFVFPSWYEGFGLPPLEAMECGCPVVVSDRGALPEICGAAALYCNPADPSDIAKQIRRLCASRSLQQEMRQAGRQRAEGFTWKSAANQLSAIVSYYQAAAV